MAGEYVALPVAPDGTGKHRGGDVERYQMQGPLEAYWTVGLGMNLGDCKSWPNFVA